MWNIHNFRYASGGYLQRNLFRDADRSRKPNCKESWICLGRVCCVGAVEHLSLSNLLFNVGCLLRNDHCSKRVRVVLPEMFTSRYAKSRREREFHVVLHGEVHQTSTSTSSRIIHDWKGPIPGGTWNIGHLCHFPLSV